MRRVVITGMGIVAPTGNTIKDAWDNALAARSGVDRITLFDASALPVTIAAEVKNYDPTDALDPKDARRTTRFIQFAASASKQALTDAGYALAGTDVDTTRYGVSIGVGLGALYDIEENTLILKEKGPRRVSPFFIPYAIANMAAGVVSINNNLKGPNMCTTTACASGTHAIGEGMMYIQQNMADMMVCGGAESTISPLGITAFAALKALSTRNDDPKTASRPFDKDRDGFVMGEGAGILVLEELEHARKRGARIYAELIGYGMSGDANHITAPAPEGEGGQRCMRMALQSARMNPQDCDYINTHGTSTPVGDIYESQAIQRVFGDAARTMSVSSTKGVTGHCIAAAGGIEAIYTVLAVHHNIIPPTANVINQDPECTLDYTPNVPKERVVKFALSNSFGFGGTNATIAMKKFEG